MLKLLPLAIILTLAFLIWPGVVAIPFILLGHIAWLWAPALVFVLMLGANSKTFSPGESVAILSRRYRRED